MTHLKGENILNEHQYGFTKGKGSTTAIAIAYETIANALANKEQCKIILRDVSKAFDKVWHDGLRHRLIGAQMPYQLTKLLSSFLDDRKAHIKKGKYTGQLDQARKRCPSGERYLPQFVHPVHLTPASANTPSQVCLICRWHHPDSHLPKQVKNNNDSPNPQCHLIYQPVWK